MKRLNNIEFLNYIYFFNLLDNIEVMETEPYFLFKAHTYA
jgi:hypothetical protein